MNSVEHNKYFRYLVSYADEMVSDSERDLQNKNILLDLAECYLKKLLIFYKNDQINCLEGCIYQKLAWIKYQQGEFHFAEKQFHYSIINLKNCKLCDKELLESYWGLTKTYIEKNNLKKAKKYFLQAYDLILKYNSMYIEDEIEFLFNKLGITTGDLLKKNK